MVRISKEEVDRRKRRRSSRRGLPLGSGTAERRIAYTRSDLTTEQLVEILIGAATELLSPQDRVLTSIEVGRYSGPFDREHYKVPAGDLFGEAIPVVEFEARVGPLAQMFSFCRLHFEQAGEDWSEVFERYQIATEQVADGIYVSDEIQYFQQYELSLETPTDYCKAILINLIGSYQKTEEEITGQYIPLGWGRANDSLMQAAMLYEQARWKFEYERYIQWVEERFEGMSQGGQMGAGNKKRENAKRDVKIRQAGVELRRQHPDWSISRIASGLERSLDTILDDENQRLAHRTIRNILKDLK